LAGGLWDPPCRGGAILAAPPSTRQREQTAVPVASERHRKIISSQIKKIRRLTIGLAVHCLRTTLLQR
jgi:hypothetical protein